MPASSADVSLCWLIGCNEGQRSGTGKVSPTGSVPRPGRIVTTAFPESTYVLGRPLSSALVRPRTVSVRELQPIELQRLRLWTVVHVRPSGTDRHSSPDYSRRDTKREAYARPTHLTRSVSEADLAERKATKRRWPWDWRPTATACAKSPQTFATLGADQIFKEQLWSAVACYRFSKKRAQRTRLEAACCRCT
jgi:hypothetical protein